MKLRILHLTAGSDAGGLSRYIFDLCQAVHADGHEVTVAGERGAWHGMFAAAPWRWIDAPIKGGPLGLMQSAKILRGYLADHPVDILHTHYRKATLVARRIQRSRRSERNTSVPILYTLHLSHFSLRWPWRWLSDFGDHTHVAASEAQRWLIEDAGVPAEQISLVPHGVQPARFPLADAASRKAARAKFDLRSDDLVALYVGRLDIPKNEDWLLDLAAATKDRLPGLKILIAGSGPHETAVRQRIASEHLESRVKLLGECDPLPAYHAADALLLPSAREGFSFACAEAMCAGLPVLRTRTSGTAEMIVENVTGKSVAINHDAFIQAATNFLADRDALRTMGIAAAGFVRENLTFDRQLEKTLALYEQLKHRA
jgi:glycosyltransferase involved in cell wall biosynthesis